LSSLHQALRTPILAASVLALALGLTAAASGAPTLSILSGPDGPVNSNAPLFTFLAQDGATVECSVDQGTPSYGPCTSAASHTPAALPDGAYTFRVRATDSVPEQTVATRSFIVDTVAPTASVASGPTGPTNDDTPTFGFTAEVGAAVVCSVDQGTPAYGPCSGAGTHTPATLTDGSYFFRVRASDAATNVGSAAVRAFSVDTVAPNTVIDSAALGTTDNQSPSFAFSAPGAVSFECRRDSEEFTSCTSPKSYAGLSEGAHTFAVRAKDAAGNVDASPAVESFTIDLTNPTLAITSEPGVATNDTTPSFGFAAEGGTTVQCSLDQGTPVWVACSSTYTSAPLLDGAYTFRVRAIDAVPHETIETHAFTVDTLAPTTTIDGGPSSLTNSANPTFTFSSNEAGATFQCRRDSQPFAACTSPKAYAGLDNGAHSFDVRATDAAGNIDPTVDSASFTIDTIAPTVSITFGPLGTTTDDSPLFEFSIGGATSFDCSIDKGTPSFGACSSAGSHVVTQRLADGAYVFRVRGTDAAGNTTIATRSFTVSTGAAKPPTQQPPSSTASTSRLLSPFPLVRLAGSLRGSGVKVSTLTVRAPRGALVRVRVQPRCAKNVRCAAKQGSATVGKKGTVRFKKLELSYREGTTIEIRVSQGTLIGKYTRFVVRRGKAPKRQDQCLKPGAKRGSACPTG
jgi:Big-like domain-containing protein